MTIDLVANREFYEDIYPSESEISDDNDEDGSDTESDDDASKALTKEIDEIKHDIAEAYEGVNCADSCSTMLNCYGEGFAESRPDDLEACMNSYRQERQKNFKARSLSQQKIKKLEKEFFKLLANNRHVTKSAEKKRKLAEKAKHKRLVKKQLADSERQEAKRRLREERARFWPKKVYRVVLSLEANTDLTPGSSRRESLDSRLTVVQSPSTASKGPNMSDQPSKQDPYQISLSISYITYSAFWSPRYDINLSTPGLTGNIVYRAEFSNTTSETWRDAKLVFSTSQTAFEGLGEAISKLVPWHIRLTKGSTSQSHDVALLSISETSSHRHSMKTAPKQLQGPREALFGLENDNSLASFHASRHQQMLQDQAIQAQSQHQFHHARQEQQQQQQQQASQLPPSHNPHNQRSFFDSEPNRIESSGPAIALHARKRSPQRQWQQQQYQPVFPEDPELEYSSNIFASSTSPSLSAQESGWEESGLTTTYDVPGTRTIPPSNTTRRHKIATIRLTGIQLSYVIIPKLRRAAFLKARLRNPASSTTLLPGAAGLTLDGSFLGNTNLPRCSADEAFSLNLGIDPAIQVGYAKPNVRRSQSGVFQKEGSAIYTRSLSITNTKPPPPSSATTTALDAIVLDQVPVSEDDRLKVDILQPKGLRAEGDRVSCGTATSNKPTGRSVGGERLDRDWGRTVAALKKNGEVCWELKLAAGQGVKLVLEYETRLPAGYSGVESG